MVGGRGEESRRKGGSALTLYIVLYTLYTVRLCIVLLNCMKGEALSLCIVQHCMVTVYIVCRIVNCMMGEARFV